MKLPRDVDGIRLARALQILGYEVTRQTGSHIRITTQRDGESHEAVPAHRPLKTGTLAGILKHVATHHRITVDELLRMLNL